MVAFRFELDEAGHDQIDVVLVPLVHLGDLPIADEVRGPHSGFHCTYYVPTPEVFIGSLGSIESESP